jgi:hypothetical protein
MLRRGWQARVGHDDPRTRNDWHDTGPEQWFAARR